MKARTTLATLLAVLALAAGAARVLPASEPAAAGPAARIVSLNPSLTAILVALGAEGVLVGVDVWSKRQNPSLAGLPTVGGLYTPNVEALVALDPDRVLLVPSAEQRDFHGKLEGLGIRVDRFDPVRFDDVLESIARLGGIAGREAEASERIAAIRRTRAEVERAVAGRATPRAILILQRDPLFVVGGGNFIDEMLTSAGARNLAREWEDGYPRISLEWLVAKAPEVILDASHDGEPAARYWARYASLPAVAEGRVVALPSGSATLPGPALDEALRLLARSVHGAEVLAERVSGAAAP